MPMNESELLNQIASWRNDHGYGIDTEHDRICRAAGRFLGFTYQQHEELTKVKEIDCSTLVSQAHWEGALIGVPFTAEGQRSASTGIVVPDIDAVQPGDVLVRYPYLDATPDKTWNHVGMFLGQQPTGERWLIESKGGVGVHLARLEEFDPRGGIRRFTLTNDVFNAQLSPHSCVREATAPPARILRSRSVENLLPFTQRKRVGTTSTS